MPGAIYSAISIQKNTLLWFFPIKGKNIFTTIMEIGGGQQDVFDGGS